ncbi:MAG: gamma-glutamylcyclotransferase family protein [Thiohalospira sp.]
MTPYFAYGSNMLTARLRARVPSTMPVGPARLADHRLAWRMAGPDGSAKCDITPAPGEVVHGVLFRLAEAELPLLDAAEGLGKGYDRETVTVTTTDGEAVPALVYRALVHDPDRHPYDWYKGFVVAGAREHGLPADYIADLEAVTSASDPDRKRAAANFTLQGGSDGADAI